MSKSAVESFRGAWRADSLLTLKQDGQRRRLL